MKKFLTSRIFAFILGAIIFGGIGTVVAATILAKDVGYTPKDTTWKVDNVKEAIDDLYTKAKPEYTGSFEVTPQEYATVIPTKDTILTKNIRVNAIPSTYKNLTTTTTVNANNLLNGIKAYASDGTLVTGTLSTNCVSGTYAKPANSQINLDLGLIPSKCFFYYKFSDSSDGGFLEYDNLMNKQLNITYLSDEYTVWDGTNAFSLNGSIFTSNFGTSGNVYKKNVTFYYMACK